MGDNISEEPSAKGAAAGADAGTQQSRVRRTVDRSRTFVGERSRVQRLTGLAVVVLLVTAPFGGLKQAPARVPDMVVAGKQFRVGPFDVTIEKIVTLGSLPGEDPDPDGGRQLVIEAVVTNPGTRSEYTSTLTDAVTVQDGGVANVDGKAPRPQPLFVKDASRIGEINPGLSYQLALVLPQAPGWTEQDVTLRIEGMRFVHEDPLTLDGDFWLTTGRTASSATLPVEVKK